jgi:hypothetical protein
MSTSQSSTIAFRPAGLVLLPANLLQDIDQAVKLCGVDGRARYWSYGHVGNLLELLGALFRRTQERWHHSLAQSKDECIFMTLNHELIYKQKWKLFDTDPSDRNITL